MSGKQFGIRLANRRLLALVMILVNPRRGTAISGWRPIPRLSSVARGRRLL